MKKWFEYQLEHQVVDRNWSKFTTPIMNVNSLNGVFAQIKEDYAAGKYKPELEPYFTSDRYKNIAGGLDISYDTLSDWINDPEYNEIVSRNGIDVFGLDQKQTSVLSLFFSKKLNIPMKNIEISVHLQKPGQMLSMHVDRIKNQEWGLEKTHVNETPKHSRYVVFFDDWQTGQIFQMGTEFLKWKAGDVYTWQCRDVPHGTANIGYEPRFMLLVQGLTK